MPLFKRVLIVADIEGSSGCWNYQASAFKTQAWVSACAEMTMDVQAVVNELFSCGVQDVIVKDFHRTGYNLIPEWIDPRAKIVSGYKIGPVPGIGDPGTAEAVIFLGLHAASGSDGFLSHTLTSRIQQLKVNGKLLPEVALFSASLAPFGIRPVFFSGCPIACRQAQQIITGINIHPIDKSEGPENFDLYRWRKDLAIAASASLDSSHIEAYEPKGPFKTTMTWRNAGRSAKQLAQRWGFECKGEQMLLDHHSFAALYQDLIRLCYLTPMVEKILPLALALSNLRGRAGLSWLRRQLKSNRYKLGENGRYAKR
jgi:D-aminopeptidase